MSKRISSISVVGIVTASLLAEGCPGYFGPAEPGGLSDVPCLTTSEWPDNTRHFAFRAAREGGDTLLFTAQTSDQFQEDLDFDFIPHEAVYRFDPASGEFTLVDDSEWDTAEGEICDGCGDAVDEGPFVIEEWKLRFNGREVPVAGRRAVNIFDARISTCVDFDAPTAEAIAVLSIDGNVGFLGGTTGQHYHQLFSKIDGSQIGSTQRLGLGGGGVHACWSTDEKYVIYQQGTDRIAGRICIVLVAEALAEVKGQ